jgi:hypothetical protein
MRRTLLKASLACFIVAIVALWVLFVTGCGPVIRNTGEEQGSAPTSSLTRAEAKVIAGIICISRPGLHWSEIQPTGSMEPTLNSYTIAVYEPCDGSDIKPHQIVVFRGQKNFILHRVAKVNATHFIGDGVSNRSYDGWIDRNLIVGRLVMPIYTNEGMKP